jgi:hypothetical protein
LSVITSETGVAAGSRPAATTPAQHVALGEDPYRVAVRDDEDGADAVPVHHLDRGDDGGVGVDGVDLAPLVRQDLIERLLHGGLLSAPAYQITTPMDLKVLISPGRPGIPSCPRRGLVDSAFSGHTGRFTSREGGRSHR